MYQALVEILIPDVLRPIPSESPPPFSFSLPLSHTQCVAAGICCLTITLFSSGALTQAIRNFAKSLEGWLNNAMNAIPQRMIQTKVDLTEFFKFPSAVSLDVSFY